MRKKRIVFVLAIAILLVVQMSFVRADDVSDLEKELATVQQKIDNLQKQLKYNSSEQKTVVGELALIEDEIAKAEKDIASLARKIDDTESKIDSTEEALATAEADLTAKDGRMKDRVRSIYKYGSVNYISVLFDADSISDLLSRYSMMKRMVQHDVSLIEEVTQQRDAIEKTKADLENERQALVTLKRTAAQRESLYQSRSSDRRRYLDKLKDDTQSTKVAVKELEQLEKELEKIISEAKIGDVKGTGVFTWPTPGYSSISSPFGYRIHPILGVNKLHTGIDIRVPYGKIIVAADTGTVTFAGNLGGYGRTVMVDHGNGKATLYAHNSRLLVKQGDVVKKGDPISKCGSTGWSTGPHLHFEVRVKGTPTNPLDHVRP